MEIETIGFHHYGLKPQATPNRLSTTQIRKGCLLKVKFKGHKNEGFADLFPWPELGDEPLELQIDSIVENTPLRLAAASLTWANYEAQAADQKQCLTNNIQYPSHKTMLNIHQDIEADYQIAKLKISQQTIDQWADVEALHRKYAHIKWRFDFNGLFKSKDEAKSFYNKISNSLLAAIDFLEDPYIPELMESSDALKVFEDLATAVDRAPTPQALAVNEIWVIKPVYFSPDFLFNEMKIFPGKVVITSNMDHSLGQLIALHAAGRIHKILKSRLLTGGLITHENFSSYPEQSWVLKNNNELKARFHESGWGPRLELLKLNWTQK